MFDTHSGVQHGGHIESPLHRLLHVSRFHRLHPGVVLVGGFRLEPGLVLDLRWSQLDLEAGRINADAESVILPATVCQLLRWHAARQRLDRKRAFRWGSGDQLLLDERGEKFTMSRADSEVSRFCEQVGLPPLTFSSLRHPCLR